MDHDKDREGNTALILAAVNGQDKIVDLLIQKGADVNAVNKHNETALMWSAWNGNFWRFAIFTMRNVFINLKHDTMN